MTPYLVYYLHYDETQRASNWNTCRDFVCCVMAHDEKQAIDKTKAIALNNHGAQNIKIMGIANGKPEWVDEHNPLSPRA